MHKSCSSHTLPKQVLTKYVGIAKNFSTIFISSWRYPDHLCCDNTTQCITTGRNTKAFISVVLGLLSFLFFCSTELLWFLLSKDSCNVIVPFLFNEITKAWYEWVGTLWLLHCKKTGLNKKYVLQKHSANEVATCFERYLIYCQWD